MNEGLTFFHVRLIEPSECFEYVFQKYMGQNSSNRNE